MKKVFTTMLAAATVAVTLMASATDADAQRRRGGAVAAGVAAGLIGAAVVGAAVAPRYGYGPGYYGYAEPVYVRPRTCVVDRQRWSNRRQMWVIERVRVPC